MCKKLFILDLMDNLGESQCLNWFNALYTVVLISNASCILLA